MTQAIAQNSRKLDKPETISAASFDVDAPPGATMIFDGTYTVTKDDHEPPGKTLLLYTFGIQVQGRATAIDVRENRAFAFAHAGSQTAFEALTAGEDFRRGKISPAPS
jgi:hypothetical protein